MKFRFSMMTLLCLVMFSSSVNAQKKPKAAKKSAPTELEKMMQEMEKNWVAPYEVQIDEQIFNKRKMNAYTSDKYDKAGIVILILFGIDYADEKAKFDKMEPKEGTIVISKTVETINGKEMLVYKTKETRDEVELIVHSYCLKGDESSTIYLTGACKPEDESLLSATFLKAAETVKIKQ